MRIFAFCLGLSIVAFAAFGLPGMIGDSYQLWMGAITGFLGGSMAGVALAR